jgi:hypothetical protein
MKNPGVVIRWILLVPVAFITLFLLAMGLVGVGFGAAPFMLAYLLSFPVFLLNFFSAKIAAIAAWCLLLVQYIPLAILNWPHANPFDLLFARGEWLLLSAIVLIQISVLSPSLLRNRSQTASRFR